MCAMNFIYIYKYGPKSTDVSLQQTKQTWQDIDFVHPPSNYN